MPHTHETPIYLEEQVIPDKRLGRSLIVHDAQNAEWPAEPLVRQVQLGVKNPLSKVWYSRGIFNQFATSTCTSQATSKGLLTHPFGKSLSAEQKRILNNPDHRIRLYTEAQRLDPWAGEEPTYYGTSTEAIMKAYRAAGFIKEFHWCFGLDDVLRTLTGYGPVVIGTWWYDSFDSPGEDGRITISPNADKRGGHETVLVSRNDSEQTVRGINSWGDDWGDKGRFEISYADLERLLEEEGEAATMVL